MLSLRKSNRIRCLLVALVGMVTVDALSARALAQGAIFRPTSEDVDPGIDHGSSSRDLPETYQRQLVFYRSLEPPGTIIVETSERHLYLIQSETRALRYGIGVGREGFTWQGLLKITNKAEWPDWHPPPEIDSAVALSAAIHGRRTWQSVGCSCNAPWSYGLPHSRHECAGDHWPRCFIWLLPPG